MSNRRAVSVGVSVSKGSPCPSSDNQNNPMTMEDLAVLVGRCIRGEDNTHPLRHRAAEILCESIRGMVYQLAFKYSSTCRMSVDVLMEDCMGRIMSRIGDFDPAIAKFTTWSWSVCLSVLNATYRRNKAWNDHVFLGAERDYAESCGPTAFKVEADFSQILRTDIIDAVNELVKKYPKRKGLIMAFFGNPDKMESVIPSSVMLGEAAAQEGISYTAANVFFKKFVRPFFLERFSDKPTSFNKRRRFISGGIYSERRAAV